MDITMMMMMMMMMMMRMMMTMDGNKDVGFSQGSDANATKHAQYDNHLFLLFQII